MKRPENLELARHKLQTHPLYGAVKSPSHLRRFAEHHVFAVWDFMTLLKSLQRDLTTVSLPWVPASDPETARLVNQLVLAEESDMIGEGEDARHTSHFEWYLEAMDEIGADGSQIRSWIERVGQEASLASALKDADLPPSVLEFLETTSSILNDPVAVRAAAFHHSRELVIPEMFLPIATNLADQGLQCTTLLEYLQRHVDVDSDEHSVASGAMVSRLLAKEPKLRNQAEDVALRALHARINLWDGILEAIQ